MPFTFCPVILVMVFPNLQRLRWPWKSSEIGLPTHPLKNSMCLKYNKGPVRLNALSTDCFWFHPPYSPGSPGCLGCLEPRPRRPPWLSTCPFGQPTRFCPFLACAHSLFLISLCTFTVALKTKEARPPLPHMYASRGFWQPETSWGQWRLFLLLGSEMIHLFGRFRKKYISRMIKLY